MEPHHAFEPRSQQMFSSLNAYREPAIAAMHGPLSVFDIGHCTAKHCDAGGLSLVDQ